MLVLIGRPYSRDLCAKLRHVRAKERQHQLELNLYDYLMNVKKNG